MASIAWWWSIPVGATLVAILWVAWAGRPKPPADTHDTLESHQRFRAAMEHDTFGGRRRTRRKAAEGKAAGSDQEHPG